jgi:hypothetical protein
MEEETKKEEIQKEETKEETLKESEKPEESQKDESQEEKPLEKMTAPELKAIAKQIPGVTGVTAMKKADLLSLIKKHRGIEEEEPKKKSVVKGGTNIKEIKQKIITLKADKREAQKEKKNKKEVNILRRRINRLKKRTRKAV